MIVRPCGCISNCRSSLRKVMVCLNPACNARISSTLEWIDVYICLRDCHDMMTLFMTCRVDVTDRLSCRVQARSESL